MFPPWKKNKEIAHFHLTILTFVLQSNVCILHFRRFSQQCKRKSLNCFHHRIKKLKCKCSNFFLSQFWHFSPHISEYIYLKILSFFCCCFQNCEKNHGIIFFFFFQNSEFSSENCKFVFRNSELYSFKFGRKKIIKIKIQNCNKLPFYLFLYLFLLCSRNELPYSHVNVIMSIYLTSESCKSSEEVIFAI